MIYPNGRHEIVVLGNDFSKGHRPQFVVPSNTWQGTRLAKASAGYSLLGTTVSSGFEFVDMELADRNQLISAYPDKRDFILRYTR